MKNHAIAGLQLGDARHKLKGYEGCRYFTLHLHAAQRVKNQNYPCGMTSVLVF